MTTYADWESQQDHAAVTVDGHTLDVAYYDAGTGDPVVFVHGIPTNSFLWRDVVEPIAKHRRVVVPDMLGYGNSSLADTFDRSIRAQERMLEELVSTLDLGTVSLVGHDLGGGVALRYASHTPELVDQLVLSNAVAYDSWPVETITELGLPGHAEQNDAEDIQRLLEKMFGNTLADDPDETFLEGMTAPWASEAGVTALVRAAVATNTNHTTEIDPETIAAETLLLWGADDEFQPIEYAERLDDDIADTTLTGLEGATHWVMEDRPERYRDELTDFLVG
ncbi:alpha/beta fold hydrolase [Haloarcula onubensis]|uniref:Alpha/beta hydrolase n=1 Tax=Haloarcula onubensis TaxID=2950539 RepID=A0ABU2FJM3_9EURY|nr:alpha/beta hydrolase [Halomicroarcula sp. S3CR25-11]MDS0280955.1 alpha/beta hydrolase [Halomicroarcula sp. S3CR25-11]